MGVAIEFIIAVMLLTELNPSFSRAKLGVMTC
jgi:hypothetical protein